MSDAQSAKLSTVCTGFMGVGAGLRGNGRFRGMLLERLHGRPVDKVICTQKFHDINYIHDMLCSVFLALDKAQGALGALLSGLMLAADMLRIARPIDCMSSLFSMSIGLSLSWRSVSQLVC